MDKIKRAVRRFLKATRKNITFEGVEAYLNEKGYKVIFFNTPVGDVELKRYNVVEKATKTKAFTYKGTAQVVFIDNNVSENDKVYLLYHEVGHIMLGHLEYERLNTWNKMFLEFEADAFVYAVLMARGTRRSF